MKAYAVGLLTGVAMVLPAPGAVAAPSPSPAPSKSEPPWFSFPLTGGGGLTPAPGPSLTFPVPSDLPTGVPSPGDPEDVLPEQPGEHPSEGTAKPSPSSTAEHSARPEHHQTPSQPPLGPPARSWQPVGEGHVRPGDYDLFVKPEDEGGRPSGSAGGASGGQSGLSFGAGGPLLPVLPLGAGIASLGLGLGALALRMRRRT